MAPARRCRSLRGVPRGRRAARRRPAAHIRSRWCSRRRHRRLMTGVAGGRFEGLDGCVHCGFCLQACPTFLATGDESDSPRGRIELMRGLERGEIAATDPALFYHLDRCLGCRGCEPVCPSGVQYGHGLEAARARITAERGVSPMARLALWALTTPGGSAVVYWFGRLLRATGLPRLLAGWGRFGFAMGMLAATKAGGRGRYGAGKSARKRPPPTASYRPPPPLTAPLIKGCGLEGPFFPGPGPCN